MHHKLFDYRGVVVDVDPHLMLSDEWYESDGSKAPVRHPLVETCFSRFSEGRYFTAGRMN